MDYNSIQISVNKAAEILKENYNIIGDIKQLPGEIDFNFKVDTIDQKKYVLKISRPDFDIRYLDFQERILLHLNKGNGTFPEIIENKDGNPNSIIIDENGNKRVVRLLSWVVGRVWSEVNPILSELLINLGKKAGNLTNLLYDFEHSFGHRNFEWDIARANWTGDYLDLFPSNQQEIIRHFLQRFEENSTKYSYLRKSIIHNDVNDNNILVSSNTYSPEVVSIIDFGDAVYTQTINDLAITIAYAIMGKEDVVDAAISIIKGYNSSFEIKEQEVDLLYVLVALRLIISVTKSAINRKKEPENSYLQISDKPAWDALEKWFEVNENFATYSFRYECGFDAHPNESIFSEWALNKNFSLSELFPTVCLNDASKVDMSVGSTWLGHEMEYNDNDVLQFKLNQFSKNHPDTIIAGGYLEPRPIYVTDAYKTEGNSGPQYRSVHLGIDFWLPAYTPVHALFDGIVHIAINDAGDKEYGGLVILKHLVDGLEFYTLYGHQTIESVEKIKVGDKITKGHKISELGPPPENGNWASHLHFQIMLDMLGNEHEFPGVTYPKQTIVWKSICPDPNLLFKLDSLICTEKESSVLIDYRKEILGKSLSLSYAEPLHIVRGSGVYLMDDMGRKYLDTVNNVAHVGHENPEVVVAGINQMSVLNTNTRYLHQNIIEFAKELLETFPEELSIVHFVNSGSEANELALRMAKAYTRQRDIVAVEVGYHGNTSGCIDISSYKFDGKGGNGAPEFTHIVPLPDAFRGAYRGENTGSSYAKHIDLVIQEINNSNRKPAAFICESIISCGGQIELPDNYLSEAYKHIRNAGGVCIADEVQVGCGRVGKAMWGFQLHKVVPDIVTIGKPIGNGHPLAAVVCRKEIAEAFANGMEYFNTFGGNPVSCAIGLKVLNVVKEDNLQQNAHETGKYLKTKLTYLSNKFPIIGDVRGQGLFLGFELVDKNMVPQTKKTNYLANRMKDFSILLSVDGKDNNVIKIKPPIVFDKENADELIIRLTQVLSEDPMKL